MSESTLPAVLIFDEDEEMSSLIASQCKSSDYTLIQAKSYRDVLSYLERSSVSLLLTSAKIPEITLNEFLKRVRLIKTAASLAVLVIMNPSTQSEQDLVINAGADETILKPFERTGLNTKIRNGLKKIHPNLERGNEKQGRFHFRDLVLDAKSFDVFSKGERLKLTPNEFKLLQALLEHPGTVLSRDRLIELVQGEGVAVIDRAVDTHIFSLRKKLGEIGDSIETVRGEGYRLG
jgi:two-component system phosphate regulon response regulator PhoB